MRLLTFAKASLLLLTINMTCFYSQIEAEIVLPPEPMGGTPIYAAINDNDQAASVYLNGTSVESKYSPGDLSWAAAVVISNPTTFKFAADIAIDNTTTALAAWFEFDGSTNNVLVNQSVAGSWGTELILDSDVVTGELKIAMNGSGGGVVSWSTNTLNETHASFYNAGAWAPFQVLGIGGNLPRTAYSANGDAAVAWINGNNLYVATSIGFTWQPAVIVDASAFPGYIPEIGMDANGNAIVMWTSTGLTLNSSRFDKNTSTWSSPQSFGNTVQPSLVSLAVAPDGTAIVAFTNFTGNFEVNYSHFDGVTWDSPTFIALGISNAAAIDSLGNGVVAWSSTDSTQLFTAKLPVGSAVLDTPILVTSGTGIGLYSVGLSSSSGTELVAWRSVANTFTTFIVFALPPPTPPTGITGSVCKNSFAMQSDRVHIINWSPSLDPETVSYYIYRNDVLISIVPATGPFTFYDHNRTKGSPDTYTVYAVNAEGTLSTPVSITLN